MLSRVWNRAGEASAGKYDIVEKKKDNEMVYDKVKMSRNSKKNSREEAMSKLRAAISRPSVSALVYGYLKEKDLNLKDMSVEEWKKIEMDLVEIVLSEVYPGEEVQEDQLNFTALAHSIAFMSHFIEALNAGLDKVSQDEKAETKNGEDDNRSSSDGPKFEV